MQRKTLTEQLREANAQLTLAQAMIAERDRTIAIQFTDIAVLRRIERRFDQLLEGVCAGMKEGNLPRRPHG